MILPKRIFIITVALYINSCFQLFATAEEQPLAAQQVLKGRSHQLTYLGKETIPNLKIEGQIARVHTQGIYVSKNSLYVSGRLERLPKKALFFRFNRRDFSDFEFLDITPKPNIEQKVAAGQDHPGGFDYDGQAFWIPVAVSKPRTSTSVIRIQTDLDTELTKATSKTIFTVDDHIGAMAFDRKNSLVYGANWDTKVIYAWDTKGVEKSRILNNQLILDQRSWALAVQDWKCLKADVVLAGGHDKNPLRNKSLSRAIIDFIDIKQKKMLDRIHIPDPDGGDRSLTHEGMTIFNNELFLLPGDLGHDAELFRYHLETIHK